MMDEDLKILNLKPWQRVMADKREAIVKEFLEAYRNVPSKIKTQFKKDFANSKDIKPRTLERHVALYKEGGYFSLIPAWNNGDKEKLINTEIANFIFRSYMVRYGPPGKKVYEDLIQLFQKKYPKLPSYSTFAQHLKSQWTPAQQLFIRDPDAWNRKYYLYVNRDWNAVDVNEVWFGDGKQIDVACLYRGKPIFPWISFFMDAHSRKFVGWIVVPTHNSLAIGQAFVYSVKQYGPPKTVYIDRGKDYKSKMISGEKVKKEEEVKASDDIDQTMLLGVFRELGVEIFPAFPHNPKEKIIEANFGIFTDRLRHLPGYRGHNIKTRPKKLVQEIKNRRLWSFEELSSYLDKFIKERNNRIHSSLKRTPNSFYEGFVPKVPSQAILDYLLMDVRRCKVNHGSFLIEGHRYRGEDLFQLSGEIVEVRRDPKDVTRAVIIYKGTVFVAHEIIIDNYRGPETLESRKFNSRETKKMRKLREEFLRAEGAFNDPFLEKVDVEEDVIPRERDIRPAPNSNVILLHKKEKMAQEVSKVLAQPNDEEIEEAQAMAGGVKKDIWARLAASSQPVVNKNDVSPGPHLVKLSYKKPTDQNPL